jgi:hypothetical protein
MDKGNTNKHRNTYSNGIKAVEGGKWGRETARSRYGALDTPSLKAPHDCYPQFKQNQRLGNHYDHKNDWIRGANEDATTRPGYVPGYKGKDK